MNNGIINSDCSNLVAGQNLCLGYVGEDCSDTYVVEANDSCEDIYDNFSINATTFMLNNPNIDEDCGNLFIGQVCCCFPLFFLSSLALFLAALPCSRAFLAARRLVFPELFSSLVFPLSGCPGDECVTPSQVPPPHLYIIRRPKRCCRNCHVHKGTKKKRKLPANLPSLT